MSDLRQGDIWWAETVEAKRRPVLVVTRDRAIPALGWLVVAPVTRTIRGLRTEIPLGDGEGLRVECIASFDNLQPLRRVFLTERAGALAPSRRPEICAALAALADC